MEQGAHLKIIYKRCLDITGTYELSFERLSVVLPKFSIQNKRSYKLKQGDSVLLVSDATIKSTNRVVSIKPHPQLYELGSVNGLLLFDAADGVIQPKFRFVANEDCDLSTLPYFCKLYIHPIGAN